MPGLQDPGGSRKNQARTEQAALKLFIRKGFHGTSVREIADESNISIGHIYSYHKSKEEPYVSLVLKYEAKMTAIRGLGRGAFRRRSKIFWLRAWENRKFGGFSVCGRVATNGVKWSRRS